MIVASLLLALVPQADRAHDVRPALGFGRVARRASADVAPTDDILIAIFDDFGPLDWAATDTPTLDLLAANGTSFTNAVTNPSCTPSRFSILTGRVTNRPNDFNCMAHPGEFYEAGRVELGVVLESRGFETAWCGKWHHGVSPNAPDLSAPHLFGWEEARAWNLSSLRDICENEAVAQLGGVGVGSYTQWQRIDGGAESLSLEYNTDAIVAAHQAWLAEDRGDDPRAAVVSFNAPHVPLHWPASQGPMPPGATDRDKFLAMIRDADRALGEVLVAADPGNYYFDMNGDLQSNGTPSTWIVFVGDNGTDVKSLESGADPTRGKGTVFQRGIHVPMIFAGPGVIPGAQVGALVALYDVLPTLIEALGSSADTSGMQGESLNALLANPSGPSPHDYVYVGVQPGLVNRDLAQAVVTPAGWKLRKREDYLGNLIAEELYDLATDPLEVSPIDPNTYGDQVLVAQLRAWLVEGEAEASE